MRSSIHLHRVWISTGADKFEFRDAMAMINEHDPLFLTRALFRTRVPFTC